jgi:hypothetical protein
VTPDGKFISCILQRDNGAQDLVLYPINGGAHEVLINTLKVGYHAWAEENELLLFVLDDSIHNSLHYYRLDSKKDRVLAKNPGRSLQKIPGENAMSFVQKNQGRISIISKIELPVLSITPVTETLPGQEYMVWLNKYVLLMSDGDKIFSKAPPIDKEWQPLSFTGDVPVIKGITRLAANSTYTKLAVVVSE